MSYEVKRLSGGDMKALAEMLNLSFTGDPYSGHFEKGLPKMWVPDDAYMHHNLAMLKDGVIIANVGIYPYDVMIGDECLRMATVGNIAVRPEHRGKNYMRLLMEEAMHILEKEHIDASRLGGLRSRYEVYGYEPCGVNYTALLTERNAKEVLTKLSDRAYSFIQLERQDSDTLGWIRNMIEETALHVDRGNDRDLYATLCAWGHIPYVAKCEGEAIGYFCLSENGKELAEHRAITPQYDLEMLCRYLLQTGGESLLFSLYPWDQKSCQVFGAICESITAVSATHLKVLNWEQMIGAFLRLKSKLVPLLDGETVIEISGFGNLYISKQNEMIVVNKTSERALFTLDELCATRFFFGPLQPRLCAPIPKEMAILLENWFPLPFSWNGQDRV